MNKNKKRFAPKHHSEPPLFSFVIKEDCKLLEFLYDKIKVIPKGKIKSMLEHRQVYVNGVPITRYDFRLVKEDEVVVSKTSSKSKMKRELPFKIIYEDSDFIAIDKPSGLLSVASDNEKGRTAYRLVSDYVMSKDQHSRIFVMHRLDEDTSGVLVFAKDVKLKDKLQESWNDIVKKRGYYAIVDGHMEKKEDTLTNYLKKSSVNLVYITGDRKNGKKAITSYKVMAETKYHSLLNVNIATGRQNQIRVQLGNINHFVIGDDKYGEPSNPLNRLGLHSYLLEFTHPFTNKLMTFKAPMPESFQTLFPKPSKK